MQGLGTTVSWQDAVLIGQGGVAPGTVLATPQTEQQDLVPWILAAVVLAGAVAVVAQRTNQHERRR